MEDSRKRGYFGSSKAGGKIGKLTVGEATGQRKNDYIIWKCHCECGGEILADTRMLQRRSVKDCGCGGRLRPGQRDISGRRFGMLTALQSTEERGRSGSIIWRCRYDCLQAVTYRDNLKLMEGTSVTMLQTVKSGCLLKSNNSGYNGVYYDKRRNRWVAQITFQGKTKYLGSFEELEKAVKARQLGEEIYDEFLEKVGAIDSGHSENHSGEGASRREADR